MEQVGYLKTMTREEFLLDMLEYYCVDPFNRRCASYDDGQCKYYPTHEGTEGCAIGRHLSPELAKKLDRYTSSYTSASIDQVDITLLPNKLRLLGIEFLANVQNLHDTAEFWEEKGLSLRGKKYISVQMIENYNLDIAKFKKFL